MLFALCWAGGAQDPVHRRALHVCVCHSSIKCSHPPKGPGHGYCDSVMEEVTMIKKPLLTLPARLKMDHRTKRQIVHLVLILFLMCKSYFTWSQKLQYGYKLTNLEIQKITSHKKCRLVFEPPLWVYCWESTSCACN